MAQWASTHKAAGICDRCGFRYKLKELRNLVVKFKRTNIKVCPSCWEADHPQLHLGEMAFAEPIALRDPRSDRNDWAQTRAQLVTVYSVASTGTVGIVEVAT